MLDLEEQSGLEVRGLESSDWEKEIHGHINKQAVIEMYRRSICKL